MNVWLRHSRRKAVSRWVASARGSVDKLETTEASSASRCRRHDARHGRPAGCRGPDDTAPESRPDSGSSPFIARSSTRRQVAEFPVRPDEADRCPGDGAADQRINDTRQRDFKALAKQVKAQQHQQRNNIVAWAYCTLRKAKNSTPVRTINSSCPSTEGTSSRTGRPIATPTSVPIILSARRWRGGVIVRLTDEQAG
ncbi:Uncharacterised protein [Klebsiella pneumoniae subsp. pneumoniae]|nr:Uncharacterised protein [Klebsiella pneumoniae subsp. pneumoniae]